MQVLQIHLGENRYGASAEVFCCEEYEDAHKQDGYQLKDGCICYNSGASAGKPKKFKTLPQKTMVADCVEWPDKEDVASRLATGLRMALAHRE